MTPRAKPAPGRAFLAFTAQVLLAVTVLGIAEAIYVPGLYRKLAVLGFCAAAWVSAAWVVAP